tara:strand:+ start:125 stop:1156 length:1032 start_codon:yes stop_codon:yes gene_type:complete
MKFFNKKEQIIDLQLTQYGKHLISKGEFKPVYYGFYDDNILYDSQYGVGTESQDEIQSRIKTNTPQLETQYVFRGIETEVKKAIKDVRSSEAYKKRVHDPSLPEPKMLQPNGDKLYSLINAIGTSELNTQYSPAWAITAFEGQISSSTSNSTGSHVSVNVPQLEMKNIKYKTIVQQDSSENAGRAYGNFPDGTRIEVLEDEGQILLSIEEKNAFYGTSNFEIEVYEIKQEVLPQGLSLGPSLSEKEHLIPLFFIDQEKNEAIEDISGEGEVSLDPTYVEYFLTINTDKEIGVDLLCEHTVDRTQGIFGNRELECGPIKKEKGTKTDNIFDTDVTRGELEECPE